jgi:hypothetical protein
MTEHVKYQGVCLGDLSLVICQLLFLIEGRRALAR